MQNPVKILKNPKTDNYYQLKNLVLSNEFPWFYNEYMYPTNKVNLKVNLHDAGLDKISKAELNAFKYTDDCFFSHSFLQRPEGKEHRYPTVNSPHLELYEKVINEIMNHNNIKISCFFRICANLTLPSHGHQKSFPHLDHHFKHNIVLIYFTNAGGKTVCVDNNLKDKAVFDPAEDDIMLFKAWKQLHYHYLAEKKRRVIIMASHI
jgi:hypothetical protein